MVIKHDEAYDISKLLTIHKDDEIITQLYIIQPLYLKNQLDKKFLSKTNSTDVVQLQ